MPMLNTAGCGLSHPHAPTACCPGFDLGHQETNEPEWTKMSIDLNGLTLDKGTHRTSAEGVCLLEAAALFAGEPHSDRPECVSPVLTAYGMALNDRWDDVQRQKLVPFIPLIIGTAGDGQDEARSYLALDWLIRTFTPAWLDLAGLTVEAQDLRDLGRVANRASAQVAGPVLRIAQAQAGAARVAAQDAAWVAARGAAQGAAQDAAWGAARDAARGAARDAAQDAAWDAAQGAAWGAAWGAARDVAWGAARDAARDVTGDVLKPTVEMLQNSALDLFTAMIDPSAADDWAGEQG